MCPAFFALARARAAATAAFFASRFSDGFSAGFVVSSTFSTACVVSACFAKRRALRCAIKSLLSGSPLAFT